jgi:hypothetical protein
MPKVKSQAGSRGYCRSREGGEQRPIIRAERACSGSNRPAISNSPLSLRPRRAASVMMPVFHGISRAEGPFKQAGRPIAHARSWREWRLGAGGLTIRRRLNNLPHKTECPLESEEAECRRTESRAGSLSRGLPQRRSRQRFGRRRALATRSSGIGSQPRNGPTPCPSAMAGWAPWYLAEWNLSGCN